ncbi:MAG: Gfo/Idh/MocA family oxidoreductase [Candidatus Bathyarchaeia archaeon]
MERLGVGIVGAGFVVTNFHIPSFQWVRDVDIVAICARHKESAEKAAQLARELRVGNPRIYTDVKHMVRDPNVHAVWIAVPNFARLDVVQAIVEAYKQGAAKHLVGVACEKPLARNVKEAQQMLELIEETKLLHGYLENQVFAPAVVKGKEIMWKRGAEKTGHPYLARCAEEHAGPHAFWFWSGSMQGGGVLNDMGCHSIEAARFLLTPPSEPKTFLVPKTVTAEIALLKWLRAGYVEQPHLVKAGFKESPVEDYAHAVVTFENPLGEECMAEITVSWSYVGPGLRLKFEVLGPEYSMEVNTLHSELRLFFSRRVKAEVGEDLIEKQEAEQGLMPAIANECFTYGYVDENREMVQCFLDKKMPRETWYDGLMVTKLIMSMYMASEKGEKIYFPPEGLDEYIPSVAKGVWRAKKEER